VRILYDQISKLIDTLDEVNSKKITREKLQLVFKNSIDKSYVKILSWWFGDQNYRKQKIGIDCLQ
jgi:hypothetical protein